MTNTGYTNDLTDAQKRANEIEAIKSILSDDASNKYWQARLATLTNNAIATKAQITELIAECLRIGLNDAAGFLKLAVDSISERADEPECCCYEYMGDNPNCPKHGGMFKDVKTVDHAMTMDEIKAEYYSDYGMSYQERNDLYCTAMGR